MTTMLEKDVSRLGGFELSGRRCDTAYLRARLQRLLVPVDFTPASQQALRYAATLGERFGSTISLLHVVEAHPFAMGEAALMMMKSYDESVREAKEQLSRLATEELSPELSVRLLVRRGQPALEILRAAETLMADLIVLAAHRRSVLGRLLFGSTVPKVERHAPCPVLVVRCDDDGMETALWQESEVQTDRSHPEPATKGDYGTEHRQR